MASSGDVEYRVIQNRLELIARVSVSILGELADKLSSNDLVSPVERDSMKSDSCSPSERARNMTKNILKKLKEDNSVFYKFMSVLEDCKQENMVRLLESDLENKEYECNQLRIEDLAEIYTATCDAKFKWYEIGMFLQVPIETLDVIEYDGGGVSRKFQNMLLFWLRNSKNRTWYALADALRNETVGRPDISADEVRIGKITYYPKHVLGVGSHGTMVYKGKFGTRDIAVKKVFKASLAEREDKRLVEADYGNRIITYYCQEQDNDFIYLELELADCNLYDCVKGRSTLNYSERDAIKLLMQAIEGLRYLHKIGIVHRDIKPHKILIFFHNGLKAKLSDFGLSKKLPSGSSSFSAHSGITGTSGWIAPEVYLNESGRLTSMLAAYIVKDAFTGEAGKSEEGEAEMTGGYIYCYFHTQCGDKPHREEEGIKKKKNCG